MKIAITGASGFVGSHLRKRFPDHIAIKRDDSVQVIIEKLKGVYAVINLAGAPIIKRWSKSYKKVLENSRLNTTRKVVSAINKSEVQLFISTSAVGIYPDNESCDESCPKLAEDFLGQLAKKWEHEAMLCQKPTTILRFGVVLGTDGGALSKMLLPFKLGLGGPIGDGSMIMSWIHIEDLMRIYQFVLEKKATSIFNAVSPNPVTNKEFTNVLARILKRPAFLPVPRLVLRLIYGEGASVLTGSKEVYSTRLIKQGFEFKYPDITSCLEDLLKDRK